MNQFGHEGLPPHAQVDGDSVMDVEIASITQLTNSVQLAEPQNLLSPLLENDTDTGMDLDGETDPSKHFPSVLSSKFEVLRSDTRKWGHDVDFGSHVEMGGSWNDAEYKAFVRHDETLLATHMGLLPSALAKTSPLQTMFENIQSHEDDVDDSEWLDSASVRADTQSIIGGDSDDDYDGETGNDDEMLSEDDAVLTARHTQ
ncbi:hypothetical protein BC827DRAFT_1233115 [Russula dissimulans]|nr:hypothetical protein BC827DRAFT_1233115 [Russula dissimulans]